MDWYVRVRYYPVPCRRFCPVFVQSFLGGCVYARGSPGHLVLIGIRPVMIGVASIGADDDLLAGARRYIPKHPMSTNAGKPPYKRNGTANHPDIPSHSNHETSRLPTTTKHRISSVKKTVVFIWRGLLGAVSGIAPLYRLPLPHRKRKIWHRAEIGNSP